MARLAQVRELVSSVTARAGSMPWIRAWAARKAMWCSPGSSR